MTSPESLPAARPVDAHAYVERPADEPAERVGYRWLRLGTLALFVLAFALTDLAPAVLAAGMVVAARSTVRKRRDGVFWWTVLEVVGWGLAVALVLVVTRVADGLTTGALAVQLVAGAVAGGVIAAVFEAVMRTVRRRHGLPRGA